MLYTEKIIQFGEGGFLRGFVDYMVQILNEKTDFGAHVVVVQPIAEGLCDLLEAQGCRYTHLCRGAEGVLEKRIEVIRRTVKPYDDFDAYLALADVDSFRFIVSNTTEAGIVFSESDRFCDRPASTFPAKVTQLLYRRFARGGRGFVFLPCELIDKNGETLRDCILRYGELWGLGEAFLRYVREENVFCNTLVDRINTGYPKGEPIALERADDRLLNASEYFHLWVIEGYDALCSEIPFDHVPELNVIVTDALEKYRTRKVRILNGAHTSLVHYAMLEGFETVGECMADARMREHLCDCIYNEILPTLDLPKKELTDYADEVLRRFENPYIHHYLASISLNSVSKFRVRVLPSILEYQKRFGKPPRRLLFSLAKLLEFYRTKEPRDDARAVELLRSASVREALAMRDLWGEDLSEYAEVVEQYENQ